MLQHSTLRDTAVQYCTEQNRTEQCTIVQYLPYSAVHYHPVVHYGTMHCSSGQCSTVHHAHEGSYCSCGLALLLHQENPQANGSAQSTTSLNTSLLRCFCSVVACVIKYSTWIYTDVCQLSDSGKGVAVCLA